jgi:hypothetical protein
MINGKAATMSLMIRAITFLVWGILIGLLVAGFRNPQDTGGIVFPVVILVLLIWGCYLRAPIFYEITADKELIIRYRWGSRRFKAVSEYDVKPPRLRFGIRLWGNGGLFAVTGIFWSPKNGTFRAYVTNQNKLVMVKLQDGKKVLISPANAEEWVSSQGSKI